MLIFGVFDGHGSLGHNASFLCEQQLPSRLAALVRAGTPPVQALERAIAGMQQALLRVARGEEALLNRGPSELKTLARCDYGTTLCLCLMIKQTMYVANVGDSRCIILTRPSPGVGDPLSPVPAPRTRTRKGKQTADDARDGGGWCVQFTSKDHSREAYPSEKDRILSEGGKLMSTRTAMGPDWRIYPGNMTFQTARKHSLTLNMTRALGHVVMSTMGLSPQPDISTVTIDPTHELRCICASDGLWNVYKNQEVVQALQAAPVDGFDEVCARLLKDSDERWKPFECGDNITVAMLHCPAPALS